MKESSWQLAVGRKKSAEGRVKNEESWQLAVGSFEGREERSLTSYRDDGICLVLMTGCLMLLL